MFSLDFLYKLDHTCKFRVNIVHFSYCKINKPVNMSKHLLWLTRKLFMLHEFSTTLQSFLFLFFSLSERRYLRIPGPLSGFFVLKFFIPIPNMTIAICVLQVWKEFKYVTYHLNSCPHPVKGYIWN